MAAVLAAMLPAASVSGELSWTPRMAAARTFAEGRAGSVSFAVLDARGRFYSYRGATTVPTVSVLKVMFAVAYLRLAFGPGPSPG